MKFCFCAVCHRRVPVNEAAVRMWRGSPVYYCSGHKALSGDREAAEAAHPGAAIMVDLDPDRDKEEEHK